MISCMAPAIVRLPASTSPARMGLRLLRLSAVRRTFASATFWTSLSLCESRGPSDGSSSASAGPKLSSSAVMLPSFTPSTALLMAPQELCPRTTIALAPATCVAYSRLPSYIDIGEIARDPGAEDVADPLIEDDLGRNPEVDAADDGGEGRLLLRRLPDLFHQVAVDRVSAHEPFVAGLEQGKRIAWGRGSLAIAGKDLALLLRQGAGGGKKTARPAGNRRNPVV